MRLAKAIDDLGHLFIVVSLPVSQPVQSALLASNRVEAKDALHGTQRAIVESWQVRVAGKSQARKRIPPHMANTVQRSDIGFAQVRQAGSASRLEQFRK
jgi:hypothetical protein